MTEIRLVRRTPLKKRRGTARKFKTPRCIYETPTGRRTCKKPQEHIERCKPHADAYLDGLVRDILGKREQLCRVPHAAVCKCGGAIQVNHGFKRGHYGTRWDLRNVVLACAGLNGWAKYNDARWREDIFQPIVGPTVYAELKALAYAPPKLDYEAVRAELTAALKAAKEATE